jgi:hypothetical protein
VLSTVLALLRVEIRAVDLRRACIARGASNGCQTRAAEGDENGGEE